jgi:hypothetical protein
MDNSLKSISKSSTEFRVGNYIILFGGKDAFGEYFTAKTMIDSPYTKTGVLHVDFEHGFDPDDMGMDDNEVLGFVDWKTAIVDEKGVFVERVLNRQARYMSFIEELIDAGVMGNSSQAISGKTKRAGGGEITEWPLMRDTLTVAPAEPRMLSSNVITAAKNLYQAFPECKSLQRIANFDRIELDNVKSALERVTTIRELEDFLRDSGGFSKGLAQAVLTRSKQLYQGEPIRGLDEKAIVELNRLLEIKL